MAAVPTTPQLTDIFDQPHAIGFLAQALRAERMPHGLIFAGPVGVGKATTAAALAAVFLCCQPVQNNNSSIPVACGACDSCLAMAGEVHPDFHRVYRQLIRIDKKESKAIDLPIDVVRQYLVEPANRKSVLNNGKVFVIEEAERMNAAAQNGLLKTLEEPYGKTLLILLTDQPHAMLSTIRSRSQIVQFSTLPAERIVEQLKQRGIETALAEDAAEFADGSLGLALQWVQDGVIVHARQLQRLLKRLLAGDGGDGGEVGALIQSAADDYSKKQLERDKNDSGPQATRDGLLIYLKLIAEIIRRQLRHPADPDHLEHLCATLDAIARAERYLDANVTTSLILAQLSATFETAPA